MQSNKPSVLESVFRLLSLLKHRIMELLITGVITGVGFAGALITFKTSEFTILGRIVKKEEIVSIVAIVFTMGVISFLMLWYLRTDSGPAERSSPFDADALRRLIKLERAALGLTPEARDELVASIRADAASQMTDEFEKCLQERYSAAKETTSRAAHIRFMADRMLSRLQTEVSALTWIIQN